MRLPSFSSIWPQPLSNCSPVCFAWNPLVRENEFAVPSSFV